MPDNGPEVTFRFRSLLAESAGKLPERILLLKDGDCDWVGVDLHLDAKSAQAVIEDFEQRKSQLPIDYHHRTLAVEAGKAEKAPAAGWIKFPGGLEYVKGEGLYAHVEWTDQAAEEIRTKQYKYYSPVIYPNPDTGEIVSLHSVALTNRPRTRGLIELLEAAELVAAKENDMTTANKDKPLIGDEAKAKEVFAAADSWVRKLWAQDEDLGVGLSVTPEQKAMVKLADLLRDKGANVPEDAGLAELLNAAIEEIGGAGATETPTETETETAEKIAAELGIKDGKRDLKTVCAEIGKLRTMAGQYEPMAKRLKALEDETTERLAAEKKSNAEALVEAQIEAGKLLPDAEEAKVAALKQAEADPEGFEKMFAGMPVVADPRRLTGDTTVVTGGRASIIKKAEQECASDRMMQRSDVDPKHFVNIALHEAGETALTEAEAKALKGAA